MKTYVATQNAGKLRELRAIFSGRSELELANRRKYADVDEDADSYAGNALIKAHALVATLRERGIEAGGARRRQRIGSRCARGTARGLLRALRRTRYRMARAPGRIARRRSGGVPPYRRAARFVCALALIEPGREPIVATGQVTGYILEVETGAGGFGYDPLFFHPPSGRSFAALSEKEKNAVSHRRRAADALLAALRNRV